MLENYLDLTSNWKNTFDEYINQETKSIKHTQGKTSTFGMVKDTRQKNFKTSIGARDILTIQVSFVASEDNFNTQYSKLKSININ